MGEFGRETLVTDLVTRRSVSGRGFRPRFFGALTALIVEEESKSDSFNADPSLWLGRESHLGRF